MTIKEMLSDKQRRSLYKVLDLLPDKLVLHLQYYASVGRVLNLRNPKRFTEKMQWYKINYENPLMTQCADKYAMRAYVTDNGYEEHLPTLYGVYDKFDEIDFDELSNSFAIKCNNGSGTNLFVTNKQDLDLIKTKEIVDSWEEVNTLSIGREWVYKNIEQKIIVEELLVPEDVFQQSNGLNDYKVLCFNGEAKYVWVDVNRANNHSRNFYDLSWQKLDVISDKPNYSGELTKPVGLEKMLEIANRFAKDFPFIRVDFYSINGHVYVGELTFYPWSGCVQFTPDSFDFEMGDLFTLPQSNTH